jgi:hypothetical protein
VAEGAIVVDDVSKRFRLYSEKPSSLKARVLSSHAKAEDFWALRDVGFATKDIPGFQSPATGAHALEMQAPIDYSVAFRQADATPLTRSDIVVDTVPSHSARHGARF